MARPKKTVEDTWLDIFVDMSIEDQAANLKLLEALHRQAKRERGRKAVARISEEPAAAPLLDVAK